MTKRFSRLLIWIIVLFIACVVGVGIYFLLYQNQHNILTATVTYTSVNEGIDIEGVAVRSEEIIYNPSGTYVSLLVKPGERVASGQSIAACFFSLLDLNAYIETQHINKKLDLLFYLLNEEDISTKLSQYNNNIYSALAMLAVQASDGCIMGFFSDQKSDLEQYLVFKDCALEGEKLINSDIAALITQKNRLSLSYEGSISYIQASAAGYFSTAVDGYERLLTPQKLLSMTPEDFSNTINFPAETLPGNTVFGKIMYSYIWYLAAIIKNNDIVNIEIDKSVYIKVDKETLKMDVEYISESNNTENTLVVFSCCFPLSDMTQNRTQRCRIILNTYEGFKIPTEGLHIVDGIPGVYVLEGVKAVFKKVNILYRADNYYVVTANFENKNELFVGDEIILGEKNLFDGKAVK